MINSIVYFLTTLAIGLAVDVVAPNAYEDTVLRPSGEPQLIHAQLPSGVSNLLQSKPTVQYISSDYNNYQPNYAGAYSYGYASQPRYQVGYQYIRNVPTLQRQYPLVRQPSSQLTYVLPRLQYEYQYYPYVNLLPNYGSTLYYPLKK